MFINLNVITCNSEILKAPYQLLSYSTSTQHINPHLLSLLSLNAPTINHISQFTKIQSSHLSRIETSCQNWKFKLTKVNLTTSLLLSNTNFSSKLYLTIYQTSLTWIISEYFSTKIYPSPTYPRHQTQTKF